MDVRSDLYARAAVGYWLLTATPLFPSSTVIEACLHHLQSPPPAPSEHSPVPIPAALDGLILRCLAKDPEAGPASALELASLLEAIDAPVWIREQGETWWRDRAPRVLTAVKEARGAACTPGPYTIAVDLERRTPRSKGRWGEPREK